MSESAYLAAILLEFVHDVHQVDPKKTMQQQDAEPCHAIRGVDPVLFTATIYHGMSWPWRYWYCHGSIELVGIAQHISSYSLHSTDYGIFMDHEARLK